MILATISEYIDTGGIALLLEGTSFIRELTTDARLHRGLQEANVASIPWRALAPESTGTGAGRLGMMDLRTQQVILYALSALADVTDPVHFLPGSSGDTANATSHWECQDSWSSILKVHEPWP